MAGSQIELRNKVDKLHSALNQMYALDNNWKDRGEWPSDEEGSILGSGASSNEIAEAESRFGHEFPPSYKEFLKLYRYWKHCWGDFTLIGTGFSETKRAQDEIREYIEDQTSDLKKKIGTDLASTALSAWESKEERHMFLANHLVLGTNFSGELWVYDTRTRRKDGELTLVQWTIDYGAQDPKFLTFHEFLDWALAEAIGRSEWTKQAISNPKSVEDEEDDD